MAVMLGRLPRARARVWWQVMAAYHWVYV